MAFPELKPKPVLAAIIGSDNAPSSAMTKKIWTYIKSEEGKKAKIQEGKKLFPGRDAKFKKLVAACSIELDSDGSMSIFHIGKIIKAATEPLKK